MPSSQTLLELTTSPSFVITISLLFFIILLPLNPFTTFTPYSVLPVFELYVLKSYYMCTFAICFLLNCLWPSMLMLVGVCSLSSPIYEYTPVYLFCCQRESGLTLIGICRETSSGSSYVYTWNCINRCQTLLQSPPTPSAVKEHSDYVTSSLTLSIFRLGFLTSS